MRSIKLSSNLFLKVTWDTYYHLGNQAQASQHQSFSRANTYSLTLAQLIAQIDDLKDNYFHVKVVRVK